MTTDKKAKKWGMRIVQSILGLMMLGVFLFFIWGEIHLPAESFSEAEECRLFQADWKRVMPDGENVLNGEGVSKEEGVSVKIPGKYKAAPGEKVIVETVLSQEQENICLCIRSLQQDIRIYVDDELRKEYSTIDSQPFGKTSTIAYVFFDLKEADAGKTLRMEMQSESSYSGFISEIYQGTQSEIWRHFMSLYGPAAILAALMLVVGMIVVAGSLFIRFFYKTDEDLLHLGNAILLASAWLLAESRLRQFFLPNSTVAMYLGFFIIMLLPYPVGSYVNRVQKRRYQKAYMFIEICTILNFICATWLQIRNQKDFYETMWGSHATIVAVIAVITVTIILDIRNGHIREYREVAIGFGGLMLAGLCEIFLVYVQNAHFNGIALCLSLIFLLAMSALRTLRNIWAVEREKQIAIAASKSKADFLANMSHEIRTPINTVIGMNEMILRENKNETIREYAFNIKSASQMLLSLINDVLDFSKIEAGKLQLTESEYHPAFMLKDVILGIEPRLKKKNLELHLEIEETIPAALVGDEIRIKQILNNLLSNAVKYTETGSVTIRAEGVRGENGFSLFLSVTDTGIGIREEDMERLFDSFQRLELQKNRYVEGSGLGLNITKQLVELMNGRIEVSSEYGKGSCFSVQIPQRIVDGTAMGKLEQNNRSRMDAANKAEPVLYAPDAKVLAVDDNQMNLKVIGALLKRSGIQLDLANGGNECLQMSRSKKYDLILMDHMMPQPDGIETLHLLRGEKNNPNRETKVIALTANVIAGIEEEYRQEGFADYLAKPVKVEKLEEVLGKHLGEKAMRQTER